ncbi:MAG: hypothetical protein H8D34_06075 [Chloroflexi bacterium]|nr:hypothetical protein [Chloroflexota bacterium]
MNETQAPVVEQPNYSSNQPTSRQWILIAGIGFFALCGIITFLAGGYYSLNSMLSARSGQATATAATATAVVVAREQAIRSAIKWPLLFLEPFNNNENEWIDGEIDDEYAKINVTINGTYRWDISSKQGFVWWVYPTSDMVEDFYLAVDVINPSENRDAPYGLTFRVSEDENFYYYFEIRETQLFSVWANDEGNWTDIVPYTDTTAIHPSANNHLEIIAQGDEYFFFINNELVAEKTILAPDQGYSGLAVGLSYEDEQSTIIFDNFELRSP